MNKVRTRRIGTNKYRLIICNTRTPLKTNTLPILIDDIYDCYPRSNFWKILEDDPIVSTKISQNHPLVNKCIGFWVNEKTICIGYNIGKVYRPIFNHGREKMLFGVRKDIIRYAKIFASLSREHLYKKELLALHNMKLPEEIVQHIANYAWDIMLLLYP